MNNSLKLMLSVVGIDAASNMLKGVQNNVNALTKEGKSLQDSFAKSQQAFVGMMKAMAVKSAIDSQVKPFTEAAGNLQEAMLAVKANIMSGFDKGVEGAQQMQAALDATAKTAEVIAQNMRFSKTEVVSAQNEMLKAGIAQGMVTGTKENKYQDGAAYAAASLSQLSGLDLGSVIAPWLGNMGDAFSFKEAKQYSKFANHVAAVDDAAATKIETIQYNVQQASSNAAALGVSPEKLVSMMGYASSLRNEAGTSVGRFMEHAAGMTPQSAKSLEKLGIHAFKKDESGKNKFVGIDDYIKQVREALGKETDDKKRMTLAHKAFGTEGGRFANLVASKDVTFADFEKKVAGSASLFEKLGVTMSGYNASVKMLEGSVQTLRAELGSGLMPGLTKMANWLNTAAGGATEFLQNHKGASSTAAWSAAAAGAVATGAVGYYGIKMLVGGMGGLKNLLGKGTDLIGGVATGKALQAAAGITPVYVTNMPSEGFGKEPISKGVTGLLDQYGKPIATTAATSAAGSVAAGAGMGATAAIGLTAGAALLASLPILLAGGHLQDKMNSKEGLTDRIADRGNRLSEMKELMRLEQEGGSKVAAERLAKQFDVMSKERDALIAKLDALANRPLQVALPDGRVLAETVNAINNRDARRN